MRIDLYYAADTPHQTGFPAVDGGDTNGNVDDRNGGIDADAEFTQHQHDTQRDQR